MEKGKIRGCQLMLVFFIAYFLSYGTLAFAGKGRFNPVTKKFDLYVSIRFDADSDDLSLFEEKFQEASELLFNATDGKHQLGTIYVCNNSTGGDIADIWICENPHSTSQPEPQLTPGCADPPGIGRADCKIVTNGPYMSRPDTKLYLVHELGHYIYGLGEEYREGFENHDGPAECLIPPLDEDDSPACIMDGLWAPPLEYVITEFCVASNHDLLPDRDTGQHKLRGKSCWETMVEFYPTLGPAPSMPDEALLTGATIDWQLVEEEVRVIVLIDSSGSMAANNKLDFAKQGAELFANLLQVGNKLGVIYYSGSTTSVFDLQEITNDTKKAEAISAINSVSNAAGGTDITVALKSALDQFVNLGNRGCQQVILLLSDGRHNGGDPPESVLDEINQHGITVHTLGLEGGTDVDLLETISRVTHGRAEFAGTSKDVLKKNVAIFAESIENAQTILTNVSEPVTTGDEIDEEVSILANTEAASFLTSWPDDLGFVFTLIDPNGVTITRQTARTDPDVSFAQGVNHQVYTVNSPVQGTWLMHVETISIAFRRLNTVITPSETPDTTVVTLQVVSVHPIISLLAKPDKVFVNFPEPVLIQASPKAPINIVNAKVSASVIRPDGSIILFKLSDNGSHETGDIRKDDGIYTNTFFFYNAEGAYFFTITASTDSNSFFLGGENLAPSDSSEIAPLNDPGVPLFTISNSFTVNVRSVPQDNFVYGFDVQNQADDPNDGRFIKVNLSESDPKITKLGYVTNNCDRIKNVTAMVFDPTLNCLFLASPRNHDEDRTGNLFKVALPLDPSERCIHADLIAATEHASIEGLALHPDTHELFGVDVENGQLVRINKTTGEISRFKNKIGFNNVESLAFSLEPEPMLHGYDSNEEKFIIINTSTGQGQINPEIQSDIQEIEALQLDFRTDAMIGFTSIPPNGFVKIDFSTGDVVRLNIKGASEIDIEGLAFIPETQLITPPEGSSTTSGQQISSAVVDFNLVQNTPNPFSTSTKIEFNLAKKESVCIQILDSSETPVCELVSGTYAPGQHTISWDGRNDNRKMLPEGVYFCQMKVGNRSKIKEIRIKR